MMPRAQMSLSSLSLHPVRAAGWREVSPDYLFRIVRALRTVGLEFEARMIAAEAVARL